MNVEKGSYNYIKKRRIFTLIRTIVYFSISAALFLAGYLTTHTQANLLTIVAVLGVLPSSKSAVAFIMYLRAPVCPEDLYNALKPYEKDSVILYEVFLTTYDKNYPLDALLCLPDAVFGLTSKTDLDLTACSEHISRTLALDNIHEVKIDITKDRELFLKRVQNADKGITDRSKSISEAIKKVML